MSDYLIFDNIDTRTLNNISVFAGSVDNTPKRVYTPVEIAGRNGVFYIDERRFEDVEQTYSIVALTKEDGSAFINALASKVGYFRLSDSFNTDEFYQATFTSGAQVKIPSTRDKSVFEITFTRKPQRFLTSGETAVSVANNGTITNPTLFDAKPQLQVKGYGSIGIGDEEIIVQNVPLGMIKVGNGLIRTLSGHSGNYHQSINLTDVVTGDEIYSNEKKVNFTLSLPSSAGPFTSFNITSTTKCSASVVFGNYSATVSVTMDDCTFEKGTSLTEEATVGLSFVHKGTTKTATVTVRTVYSGSSTLTHHADITNYNYISETISMNVPDVYADSTKTATGNPLYIDLDIGEAWNEDSGTPVSLNNAVQIPAELPTLPPGSTTITYDNTITLFKVLPRWWKV